MKKRLKLLLTVGLALGAVSVLGYLGIAAPPDIPNLVQYHKVTHDPATTALYTGPTGAQSQNCIACHGDKRVEASLSNYYKSAHKTHNTSVYLTFNLLTPTDNDGDGQVNEDPFDPQVDNDGDTVRSEDEADGVDNDGDTAVDEDPVEIVDNDGDGLDNEDGVESECAKCHYQTDTSLGIQTVDERGDLILTETERSYEGGLLSDITTESPRAARKQVDPALCLSCHGAFRTVGTESGAPIVKHTDGGSPANAIKAMTQPRGCKQCHETTRSPGDPQVVHRQVPYVNGRYAATTISCMKCHGGYNWYMDQEPNAGRPDGGGAHPGYDGFRPYWPQDLLLIP